MTPVKMNRSFLSYFLLTLVTCGIYHYIFIYELAHDMNTICMGDGKDTAGLLQFILFSFITCGIYTFVWFYLVADRLEMNGQRYNVYIKENGTTILLWMILGSFLCGIGPYVAIYLVIKNTNALAVAYMSQNNYNYN